jgi:hypothetical protein
MLSLFDSETRWHGIIAQLICLLVNTFLHIYYNSIPTDKLADVKQNLQEQFLSHMRPTIPLSLERMTWELVFTVDMRASNSCFFPKPQANYQNTYFELNDVSDTNEFHILSSGIGVDKISL